MRILSIISSITVFCIIACVVLIVRSRRSKYYKLLNKYKAEYKYQTMNLKVLVETCKAIGDDRFHWTKSHVNILDSYKPYILWYRFIIPSWFDEKTGIYRTERHIDFLIDIPWLSCVLFRRWWERYSKQNKEAQQEIARCKNSTNDVLQDIQKKLEATIQKNYEQMKDAATQQEQILSRLSQQ